MEFFAQVWRCVKSAPGLSLVIPTRRPEPLRKTRARVQTSFGALSRKSSVVFTRQRLAPGVPGETKAKYYGRMCEKYEETRSCGARIVFTFPQLEQKTPPLSLN
jgi:hypothetical protein